MSKKDNGANKERDVIDKIIMLWKKIPVFIQLFAGLLAFIALVVFLWMGLGVSPGASSSLIIFSYAGLAFYKRHQRKKEAEKEAIKNIRDRSKSGKPASPPKARPRNTYAGHNQSLIEEVDPEKLRGFENVAGCDFVITELQEIIDYLKDPEPFQEIGARVPQGVLLEGDPGTGKTLLAEAMAKECGVPFFKGSGSEFVELYVGTGAARVRDMFRTARGKSPSILFIDEIDAVGGKRGRSANSNDEREQALNQLLVEMDGLDIESGVIVIAATNRFDMLDPALTRAGRFDRHVTVPVPDLNARVAILEVHAEGKPIDKNVNLRDIAELVPGFVGADLENLLNEAALLAHRGKRKKIKLEDIENAIDRVVTGSKRETLVLSEKELKTVAYHEGGHTLVGILHEHADYPQKVTIIPRTKGSLGHTFAPPADKYLHSKEELIARIAVLYGGRAAETLKFDKETTGASNDLAKAIQIARSMVMDLGMSSHEKLKGRSFAGTEEGTRAFQLSEDMKQLIDNEVGLILKQAEEEASQILETHASLLDMLAEELIRVETMNKKDLAALVDEYFKDKPKTSKDI